LNLSIFEGLPFPAIELLEFIWSNTEAFPFLNILAERVLQAHPGNPKCLSKISLRAYDPDAYQMIGDFLIRFRQIAARLTEFKAVMHESRSENIEKELNQEPFKRIENALKIMKNLKILELDGDPYLAYRKVENDEEYDEEFMYTTQPYRLDQIPSI
jgi:hypothetical protein